MNRRGRSPIHALSSARPGQLRKPVSNACVIDCAVGVPKCMRDARHGIQNNVTTRIQGLQTKGVLEVDLRERERKKLIK